MPNQNYFEAREELKMAQCDLSLSYPTCKTEERLCKYAYSSWCPTCDKESPRRRSKSETNEPCRRKGREMKGTPKKYDWNQECENMDLEYEMKDVRFDNCRVRSNLCELPTTYITNNCQMMKLSSCPSDFVDVTEKGIKCYENSLKSNDFNNSFQNFGSMVDRQERIAKLFPRIEESTRNINGIVNKILPKLETLKPHLHPVNSTAPIQIEPRKTPERVKHASKNDGKKLKPINGTALHHFQSLSPKHNELYNLELRNRTCNDNLRKNQHLSHGDFKEAEDPHLQLAAPKPPFTKSAFAKSPQPANCNVVDLKFREAIEKSNLYYDTCTFFDKKVDVASLKERYTQEVELLKERLRDLKNSTYDNQFKAASAPSRHENYARWPPASEIQSAHNIKADFKRQHQGGDTTGAVRKTDFKRQHQASVGAVPKASSVIVVAQKKVEPEMVAVVQPKRDRLKSASSKVSLKTKAKVTATKLRKPRTKAASSVVASSDVSDSDCSGSEDSDKETNLAEESESLDELSTASSFKDIASSVGVGKHVQSGAGDASIANWPLRASLFPHIPPYLCFISHEASSTQKLPVGTRYLKWKMSTITPVLVRKTLTNSGFRLVRKSNEWMGTWGKHMKSPMFTTLKDTQKLNHFPGTFQIGRKDRLWRNFQKLIHKHGHREFGFTPQTYVLPQDLKLLKQHWQNKNGSGDEKYIIKPPASARGTGIKVINRWSQLPKRMSLVVQEYISNPYLINGSKFDLRLYVLVTSFDPLRIYLWPDGLARFASVPYSDDAKDLKDRYMHLTNYSINKLSSLYTANEDANACKGHKWTLSKLWEYMSKQGVDTKALWKNLQQLVIKTLISGESAIVPLCRENMNSRYNCYELFGVDVLLDEHLKSWLLEVNISPSLHSQSPLDEYVKGPMVQCLFELAQFHLPPRLGKIESRHTPPCFDPRVYSTTLTKKERNKHNYFCHPENRQEYLEDILADLTGDDVRHLTQAEDELVVIGRFERIFPTAHTHKYLEFLDVRYYNRLFDAWEYKYESNRQPGIKMLQSLCETKMHLKVAPPTVLHKSLPSLNPGDLNPLPNLLPSKEGQTHPEPAPVPVPSSITVSSVSLTDSAEKSSAPSNKSSMDIKSLYNVLRFQSDRSNMVLRPFSRTDFATHV